MSTMYLISSEVNGVLTYYTADSGGIISSIGNTLDFTKGFSEEVLANVSNLVYSSLTNGKLWRDTTDVTSGMTIETDGNGTVVTKNETAIDTKGYSGIVSITPVSTGDVRFGLSFNANASFKTMVMGTGPSTVDLIPTSNRASVVAIASPYDSMFDGNENTSCVLSTSTYIPIEFTSIRKIRKFVGKLSIDSIIPVTITLQIYDAFTSDYKDLSTVNIGATNTLFSHEFENSEYHTSYRFKLEFINDGYGIALGVIKLNVCEEVSKLVWVDCQASDIPTIGLTSAALSALNGIDYAYIFNNTQLDYTAYIPAGATFTKLTVTLPTNTAPNIINFRATPNSIHSEDVNLSFIVDDLEKLSTTYKISLNGAELVPTTSTPENTIVEDIIIPNSSLTKIGVNIISILVTDELGAYKSYDFNITKVNNLPSYVGSISGNEYNFVISDIDGDRIKFKIELNGVVIEEATNFIDTPFPHTTILDSSLIMIGDSNSLKVTITDSAGGVTVINETFIGEYNGLMFSDEGGNYLSTDLGELLKYLDFSVITAGYDSTPKEVQVINKTKYAISAITIVGPNDINGKDRPVYDANGNITGVTHIEGSVFVLLSNDDVFTNASKNVSIEDLNPDEKVSIYIKISSKSRTDSGDFTFNVNGTGKLNN